MKLKTIIAMWAIAIIGFAWWAVSGNVFVADQVIGGKYRSFEEMKTVNGNTTYYAPTVFVDERNWLSNYAENTAGLSADAQYIVIDLDDTTNYNHTNTDGVWLKAVDISGCVDGNTGLWEVRLGVVVENDATDGSVWWFAGYLFGHGSGCDISPKKISWPEYDGIDLVLDGNTPRSMTTMTKDTDDTDWDNDDNKITFVLTQTPPEPGDIVADVIELVNENKLKFTVGIVYRTE